MGTEDVLSAVVAWTGRQAQKSDLLLLNEVMKPLEPRGINVPEVPEEYLFEGSIERPVERLAERVPPRPGFGPVVGRERMVKRLGKLYFDRSERQIKVYGPEGSGKTAVAVEFAHAFQSRFPGGVIWLNGNFMVWDARKFLVEELRMRHVGDCLDTQVLRAELWKFLFSSKEDWLLVIDDASDDALEWIPPMSMMTRGLVLITSKSKSGPDMALRVELPLLSAKSASDVVLRYANKRAYPNKDVMQFWTDQVHLCKNILGQRLLGFLVKTYELTLEELLDRYDPMLEKAVMPDLFTIMERYQLKSYIKKLRNIGVINTSDYIRGRPWSAISGLSRKEVHIFERIQENLFRSRNRLSTKLLCKIWKDILKDPEETRGRQLWELLRVCCHFNSRNIPVDLIVATMASLGYEGIPETHGDLIYFAEDGALSIQPSLLEAVRSIHTRRTEQNRGLAKRVVTSLQAYCVQRLMPKATHSADTSLDQLYKLSISMLPHIYLAVSLCTDLLVSKDDKEFDVEDGGGDEEDDEDENVLPADFVVPKRHSLFSVASGASASTRSISTVPRDSSGAALSSAVESRRSAASRIVSSTSSLTKQLSRRFTPKSKRGHVYLHLADLNMVQGFLLLLMPLGNHRFAQAEFLLRRAAVTYKRFDERAHLRTTKALLAECFSSVGDYRVALEILTESIDASSTDAQHAFALSSMASVHIHLDDMDHAEVLLGQALERADTGRVAARSLRIRGWNMLLLGNPEHGVDAVQKALEIYEGEQSASSECAQVHKALGALYDLLDHVSQAISHLEDAIEIEIKLESSELSETYCLLASVLARHDKHAESLEAYQSALDILESACSSNAGDDQLFSDHLVDAASVAGVAGRRSLQVEYSRRAKEVRKKLRTWLDIYGSAQDGP